jgi:hypothetical protein
MKQIGAILKTEDIILRGKMNKEERFEKLYNDFFSYIYKYEVGYENDFTSNKEKYINGVNRTNFREILQEAGMQIKVCDGY